MKPRPIVLNQSSLKDFMNCNRLFAWQRLEGLAPAGARASALEIGIAVHAGLAAFHSGTPLEDTQAHCSCIAPVTDEDTEPGPSPECDDCTGTGVVVTPGVLSIMTASLAKGAGLAAEFDKMALPTAIATAEDLLRGYIDHWENAKDVWAPLNQEVEFTVEVGDRHDLVPSEKYPELCSTCGNGPEVIEHTGSGVFLRGRADNLSMINGALWLVDYKTAAKNDPRSLAKYDLDIQLSAYMYGLSKTLTELSAADGGPPVRIEGSIIDLLVKTKVPQYVRESYTRTEDQLREFAAEFVEYGQRIRSMQDRVAAGEDWKTVFPKNTEHCFRYYTCAFRDVCIIDTPERRRAILDLRTPDYVDEAQQKLDAEWLKEQQ